MTAWSTNSARANWSDYLGSSNSAQYSELKQVHKGNVHKLELVWQYPVERVPRFGFNPLVVDGVMYVLGTGRAIVALDAVNGKEIWSIPTRETKSTSLRGFSYWENSDRSDRRLLYMSDNQLFAVNARTGTPISSFGNKGKVDLRKGLGRKFNTDIRSDTPGRVYKNLIIVGSATGEDYGSPPGHVRAYDIQSGKMAWIFHTIPQPGEFGYETWPKNAWKTAGGANVWGEMSVDEERGIVYLPTGSATFDFHGADRKGSNLFANCLIALDAKTGKRLWHYQVIHHDLWDYDLTTAPKLLTIQNKGKPIDVVAQVTKHGFVFVFDRGTGSPIWPIEERPVPRSDVPGEEAWPTQPIPTLPPPFARQKFSIDDLNPHLTNSEERTRLKELISNSRNEGIFTPPSLRETIQMPGNNGGGSWGAAAIDPTNATLFVQSKDYPAVLKLSVQDRIPNKVSKKESPRYTSNYGLYVLLEKPESLPAIKPPWSTLTAYNLNDGSIKWQIPLGEVPQLAAKNIKNTGSIWPRGGIVVTAGGVIFSGTRTDKKVRAYDKDSGQTLWEQQIPARPEGVPSVYEVSGRQFVVFSAGYGQPPFHIESKTDRAGYYVFALKAK